MGKVRPEGLKDYFRELLSGPSAHYRVYLFLVTDQNFTPQPVPVDEGVIDQWGRSAHAYLAPRIAKLRTNPGTRVQLYVYELQDKKSEDRGRVQAALGESASFRSHAAALGLRP